MKYIIQIAVVVIVVSGYAYGQEHKGKDIFTFNDLGFMNEDSSYCSFDGGMGYFEVRFSTINYNKEKQTLVVTGMVCERKTCETFCDIIAYTGSFDSINCSLTIKNKFIVDCSGHFNANLDLSTDDKIYFDYIGFSLIECSVNKTKLKKYH